MPTPRSGARSVKIFSPQNSSSRLLRPYASNPEAIDVMSMQEETCEAVDILADIQASLGAMDSARAEARACNVLFGLSFLPGTILRPYATLSGGWLTRCSLASSLFQKVDILFLDECTNFLDLPAIVWLQGFVHSLWEHCSHHVSFASSFKGSNYLARA